jgi:long-chain acyl-CoA synthetase
VFSWEDFLQRGRDAASNRREAVDDRVAAIGPDDLAILVYTSGTTGPPKGVMLTHRNLLWACGAITGLIAPREEDELISFLPLCHIAERVITVFHQVVNGSVVSFAENLDTVKNDMGEVRPHVFFAVPRIWEKLMSGVDLQMKEATWLKRAAYDWARSRGSRARSPERAGQHGPTSATGLAERLVLRPLRKKLGLDRVRYAISGAAPISPQVIAFFQSIGVPLVEAYGQTESSALITANPPGFAQPGVVGPPVSELELRIAEDGEVLAKSSGVMMGYYRDEEATRQTVVDGWLHTGDVGELDEHGCLRITDRKKDLIITGGGKNIAPQYIENKLRASPYVNDAIVIGDGRKFITALIILDEDNLVEWAQRNSVVFGHYQQLATSPEVHRLIDSEIERVNETLTHVEAVKRFKILERRLDREEGELTPTLKVRRAAIAQKYSALIDAMYSWESLD